MRAADYALLVLAAVIMLLLGIIFWPAPSDAADDHRWIQDGPYTTKNGVHCCGPQHCRPIGWEAITLRPDGATVKWRSGDNPTVIETVVPRQSIFPSLDPDGRPFFCITGCLFLPPQA